MDSMVSSTLFSSAIFNRPGSATNIRNVNSKAFGNEDLVSWDEIALRLKDKQTEEEREFRSNIEKGIGVGSPLNKVRLYEEGIKEEDVRVVFYRDSASWCPHCQKVWLCLEEKRIPYRIEKINMSCYGSKPKSFLRLQPNGQLPVVKVDGTIYNQSSDIIFVLERVFPNHKALIPVIEGGNYSSGNISGSSAGALKTSGSGGISSDVKRRLTELMKLEKDLFSAWLYWLTGNNNSVKEAFIYQLDQVESELQSSTSSHDRYFFFLGANVSIIDIIFAPLLERIVASLPFFKGFQIRVTPGIQTAYPSINRWFVAMEGLESYQLTKGDYYNHCWNLPPQLGDCTFEEDGEYFENAINGAVGVCDGGGSWEYPLEINNGGVEPDWNWCGDAGAAQREVVERLSFNHDAIVGYATRGASKEGSPPYSAALSDPNAVGDDGFRPGVDICLRLISLALIEGGDQVEEDGMDNFADAVVKERGMRYADGMVRSLVYLRDRVGVPRDMRLPAAREFRARLNWAIGKILMGMETHQDCGCGVGV